MWHLELVALAFNASFLLHALSSASVYFYIIHLHIYFLSPGSFHTSQTFAMNSGIVGGICCL